MTRSTHAPRALRLVLVALAATLALAGILVASSPPAHATAAITIDGQSALPTEVENLQEVEVAGTGFTPGNYVFVAVCNLTLSGHNGTHCDLPLLLLTQVAGNGTWSLSITLHSSFADWNFQTGALLSPGHFTVCAAVAGANAPCVLQAVEYTTDPPSGPPVRLVTHALLFS